MARIRTIKPQFWDDLKVGRLSRDARLLYIGMWNFADDVGVVIGDLYWLKSKVFPYDQIQFQQFEKWIKELEKTGFIYLFSHAGEEFICLPTFSRHQVINKPNLQDVNVPIKVVERLLKQITEQSRNNHGTITEQSISIEDKEEEYNNITIPNGIVTEETSSSPVLAEEVLESEKVDFDKVVQMFHSICTSYPKVIKLSQSRKNKIRLRLKEMGDINILQQVFVKMQNSKFMQGDNKQGWKADFDWVFANDKNWPKILEGKYDNACVRVTGSELMRSVDFQRKMGVTQNSVVF